MKILFDVDNISVGNIKVYRIYDYHCFDTCMHVGKSLTLVFMWAIKSCNCMGSGILLRQKFDLISAELNSRI